MNFPEIVRPAYIGDYVAILREIEIRPDRLTEGLPWWEEYGDQDVVSVALGFEILDGSAEAIRPRAYYEGSWPYDRSLHRVFGRPKTRPSLRIEPELLRSHFRVAVEKSTETRGSQVIEHWFVAKILDELGRDLSAFSRSDCLTSRETEEGAASPDHE
jgi:hypothetical protein